MLRAQATPSRPEKAAQRTSGGWLAGSPVCNAKRPDIRRAVLSSTTPPLKRRRSPHSSMPLAEFAERLRRFERIKVGPASLLPAPARAFDREASCVAQYASSVELIVGRYMYGNQHAGIAHFLMEGQMMAHLAAFARARHRPGQGTNVSADAGRDQRDDNRRRKCR